MKALVTHTVGKVNAGYPGGISLVVYFTLDLAFLGTSQCTSFSAGNFVATPLIGCFIMLLSVIG